MKGSNLGESEELVVLTFTALMDIMPSLDWKQV